MAGRGRGRGAGAAGGLKGATWDFDPLIKLDAKPSDLYPEQIHRGPLFTQSTRFDSILPVKKFNEEQLNRQINRNRKAHIDPFFGVETYSLRYAPKKNELPKLSDRPFNKELFPKELWPTLEGTDSIGAHQILDRSMQKKELILGDMETSEENRAKVVLEKIHSLGVEGEDAEDDDDNEPAEIDDEFDDDELGGDYDAEQYFDGGDGDSDGDAGGGGGGDEDF